MCFLMQPVIRRAGAGNVSLPIWAFPAGHTGLNSRHSPGTVSSDRPQPCPLQAPPCREAREVGAHLQGSPRRGSPVGDPSASVSPGCTRQQHRGIEEAPHSDSGASLPAPSILVLGSASSVTFGEFSLTLTLSLRFPQC